MEIFEVSRGWMYQDKNSGQSYQLDLGCERACPGFLPNKYLRENNDC